MENIKLLGKWDTSSIAVKDRGLQKYISLKPVLIPRTFGRHASQQFHKSYINIVERFINHIFVPGHRGKKHLLTSGQTSGKTFTAIKLLEKTFKIIEERTKKNPVEVLVSAVENAALREEITSFQVGGIIVRKAVITAPQRRVDMAIRLIVQGAYQRSFGKPKKFHETLAEELLGAYNYDPQSSSSIREKERIEREAAGAR